MKGALTESEREELLAELTDAHNVASKALSELRSRYPAKMPIVKTAVKAERDLFRLKRELEKLALEAVPPTAPLPDVRQGGKVIDLKRLKDSRLSRKPKG